MKIRGQSGKKIAEVILGTVALAGVLSVALLAPNAIQMFKFLDYKSKSRKKFYIKSRISKFIEEGLLEVRKVNGKKYFVITKRGSLLLQRLRRQKLSGKKWDQRWRIVIFDIDERRRRHRDLLRKELKEYGFRKLQRSVWVTPYPCEDFITLLKFDLGLGAKVLYIESDKVEYYKKFKKEFGL